MAGVGLYCTCRWIHVSLLQVWELLRCNEGQPAADVMCVHISVWDVLSTFIGMCHVKWNWKSALMRAAWCFVWIHCMVSYMSTKPRGDTIPCPPHIQGKGTDSSNNITPILTKIVSHRPYNGHFRLLEAVLMDPVNIPLVGNRELLSTSFETRQL